MKKITEKIAWGCIIVGCSVFVIYLYGLCTNEYSVLGEIKDEDIERTGQIGDFFGGIIGSIWALAGVLLYFSALKMQSQELSNQIREMNDSKKMMQQQQFETTFFNLLKTQQELKGSLKGQFFCVIRYRGSFQYHSAEYESEAFFRAIYHEMRLLYSIYQLKRYTPWDEEIVNRELNEYYNAREHEEDDPDYDCEQEINHMFIQYNQRYLTSRYRVKEKTVNKVQEKLDEMLMCRCIYGHIFAKYQDVIGHYCRHLYNIMKFLDYEKQKCLNEIGGGVDKQAIEERFSTYVAFIQSMLTTSELCVLFYNALLFPKAEHLFVKYNLFDNLLEENLLQKKHVGLMKGSVLKTSKDIFHQIIEDLKGDEDGVNDSI